ncbi:tetratricopeptide repeat protein [Roseibium hamelinense]|nr:tetratricopeptide repeat protein [Roseibium hamelinense]
MSSLLQMNDSGYQGVIQTAYGRGFARLVAVCMLVSCIGLGDYRAQAFDGTPADPDTEIGPQDLSPSEALRAGARQYYSGDKEAALNSLRYAADHGQSMAAWKLGEMYAHGDGVQEDDLKAFEYYSQVVREHGDDSPTDPDAPFVASAFVALGNYYRDGIGERVTANPARAKQIFTHAASYFGDADAQFELGRMYQGSNARMAVRWFNLAAIKGHVGAQARLGETLFTIGQSDSRKARGLMWLSVALEQASANNEAWIRNLHEKYFGLASELVRAQSRDMSSKWLSNNRPELYAAQQTTTE